MNYHTAQTHPPVGNSANEACTNSHPRIKKTLLRLTLAGLSATLSMLMPSAAGQTDAGDRAVMERMQRESERESNRAFSDFEMSTRTASAGNSAADRISRLKKDAQAITVWNMRIDQHVAPFLDEFLKDEKDRTYFEATRAKHLVLEEKTRAAVASLEVGKRKGKRPPQEKLDAVQETVAANTAATKRDHKQIEQLVTKTIKQVRAAAKTETDPARKKELLDKAQQASKWMELNVDEDKPLFRQ